VLAVVLLAVVAPPRGVDLPAHGGAFVERAVEDVQDGVTRVDDRQHGGAARDARGPRAGRPLSA
jgi:hypothetical protein